MPCLPAKKHERLVLAVYPRGKAAVPRPNNSELQYLTYYASSRPKKLVKVGHYLANKNSKDIYWQRQADVLVTNEICAALIEKCHANLNLFAHQVLQIIHETLATREGMQIERACFAFSTLCHFHDGSGFESEQLFSVYLDTLRQLADLSKSSEGTTLINVLQAINVSSTGSALYIARLRDQLEIVIGSCLVQLTNVSPAAVAGRLRAEPHRRGESIADIRLGRPSVDTVPQNSSERVALATLRQIFDSNSPYQVSVATETLLELQPDDDAWLSSLLQTLLECTPINLRFHVVGACLSSATNVSRSFALAQALLGARVSLVGLSVIDVLESLTLLLIDDDGSHTSDFVETVKLLASHAYYKNQISDVCGALLARVGPNLDGPHALALDVVLSTAKGKVPLSAFSASLSGLAYKDESTQRTSATLLDRHRSRITADSVALRGFIDSIYRLGVTGSSMTEMLGIIALPWLDGPSAVLMLQMLCGLEKEQPNIARALMREFARQQKLELENDGVGSDMSAAFAAKLGISLEEGADLAWERGLDSSNRSISSSVLRPDLEDPSSSRRAAMPVSQVANLRNAFTGGHRKVETAAQPVSIERLFGDVSANA
ncbi:plasma membrane localization protein [Savitreella phatthalungensis]